MRIVAKLPDGQIAVLTKSDFVWSELDFGLKMAMRLWSPVPHQVSLEGHEYWALFADFMIKFKWLELPFWHMHSMLLFLDSGMFLRKLPGLAESEQQIRSLFQKVLANVYPQDDPVFLFLNEFTDVARQTRQFRNKLVHKPWASQEKKIGVCGIHDGKLTFDEITKEDLWINYVRVLEITTALTQMFLGLQSGFVKKYSNATFEGFSYYPSLRSN